nr:hypothetical protein [Tanacetum cinerariifolium]
MPTDNTNNATINNVAQNVVNEDLPQLFDSRGGSHVTNVPNFDVDDFSSWKDRFLVYLDGLEPYLLEVLENRPFMPMSPLSTSINPLTKPLNQWSLEDIKLANQDKRLKSRAVNEPDEHEGALFMFESNSDVEEDTRSSSEFLVDMNVEFHDRALLANQKRFYKTSGRVGSTNKTIEKTKETCFACGKLGHFQKTVL